MNLFLKLINFKKISNFFNFECFINFISRETIKKFLILNVYFTFNKPLLLITLHLIELNNLKFYISKLK